ncbi:MAG: DUF421 domain-containing protein [Oculatellaceae cyanobacterium bins.114]|nr:DUF421 domain-containing protein [Oculatellaceae cyanobacterium bins.114]
MDIFNDIWTLNIPILEKIIRPMLVYFFLLIALRLGGKRELGQMTGFDLVVLLMLSNTIQNAIIGNDNSVLGGLIGAATLLITNYFVVRFAYRYPQIEQVIEGKPTLLIFDGQFITENLAKELISEAELRVDLRRQGFKDVSKIKSATLETSGTLTVEHLSNAPDPVQANILERLEQIVGLLTQEAQSSD